MSIKNHLAGLKVSVCTKFQIDSFDSHGVMVPKVIFFELSDHPNITGHLTRPYTSVCTRFQVESSEMFGV